MLPLFPCQGCLCREQCSMIAAVLFAWLCANKHPSPCSMYSNWLTLYTNLPGSCSSSQPVLITLHLAAGVDTQWQGGPTVAQL